jgi:hypothetical protein
MPDAEASRDQDVHKGATEDDRPIATTNAPGLDTDGLPNDDKSIAENALALAKTARRDDVGYPPRGVASADQPLTDADVAAVSLGTDVDPDAEQRDVQAAIQRRVEAPRLQEIEQPLLAVETI